MQPGQQGDDRFSMGDDLPAVQPPSSGFFVQLFLLPALIVFGLAMVWFLFGRIAETSQSAQELLTIVCSERLDRWKYADDLTRVLRNDPRCQKDEEFAYSLARELSKALENQGDDAQKLQEFLAGAMQHVSLPHGAPALRDAAKPEQAQRVREAALLSLARLAANLPNLREADPNISWDLREYLRDRENNPHEIREYAALTLGLLKDTHAVPDLTAALDDPRVEVQFNAANALANLGSDAAMQVLARMLDNTTLTKTFVMEHPEETDAKLVDEPLVLATHLSAITSLERLHRAQPDTKFTLVIVPLQELTQHSNTMLALKAKGLLLTLQSRK